VRYPTEYWAQAEKTTPRTPVIDSALQGRHLFVQRWGNLVSPSPVEGVEGEKLKLSVALPPSEAARRSTS